MVGITTSMFSQLQMVNDSIYSSGNLICVIHPIDDAIVTLYNIDEKTKKSISVLARVEYPDSKFEFYTSFDSVELTSKEGRKLKRELNKYPLKKAGKDLEVGSTVLLLGPMVGGLISFTINPVFGGLVVLTSTLVGHGKLISAGRELQNYEVDLVN